MSIFKYLPAIFALKDVTNSYKEAEGKDKPKILSKRVVGSAITAGSVITSIALGLEIDKDVVLQLIDNMNVLTDVGYKIYQLVNTEVIPVVIAIYGVIMAIKGKYDATKRNGVIKPEPPPTQ